jgi:hypothetical protein
MSLISRQQKYSQTSDTYAFLPNEKKRQIESFFRFFTALTRPLLQLFLKYIHTYHSRFIPEGVAEVSQIFLRHTYVLPKFVSYEEHCRRERW